jgi:hypothetical protein
MNMDRRQAIAGAAATVVLASMPIPTVAKALSPEKAAILTKIAATFPVIDGIQRGTGEKVMAFFMTANIKTEDTMGFRIIKEQVDPDAEYELANLIPEDIETMSSNANGTFDIIQASNLIAKKTRRAQGNHYAVFPDHILVWYKSIISQYDSPIIQAGSNVSYNPNAKDYFVRVEGITLSDEDHEALSKNGMIRVA